MSETARPLPGAPGAPREAPGAPPGRRFVYLDALKVPLTLFVLAVHAAITYGAAGSWFYRDPASDFPTSVALTFMNSLCQAFFMGLYFFIAGFFTLPSLRRKGPGRFLVDRLVRLGLPLVVFFFLLNPLSDYPSYRLESQRPLPLLAFLGHCFREFDHFGSGPLWFVQTLLGFSLLVVLGRLLAPRLFALPASPAAEAHASEAPGRGRATFPILLAVALGTAGVTFAVRLAYPMGAAVSNLQLGNFPQYVVYFFAGLFVYRRGLLDRLLDESSLAWRIVSALCILAWPVMLVTGGAIEAEDPAMFMGGPHWQAVVYAVWEQVAGVAFSLTLLGMFRRRLGSASELPPVPRVLAASTYAVYATHAPVLVWLAHAGRSVALPPAVKFLLLLSTGAALCWLASELVLRRIPGVRRVLY